MEKVKENSRVTKTKKRVKESVVELLKQGDASLINVCSICEHAGINRTTFYKHYQDKESLLREMVLDTVDASSSFLMAFLEKKNPSLAMTQMLQYYRNNDGFFLTLMKTDYANAFTNLMINTLWEKNCQWLSERSWAHGNYDYYRIVYKVSGIIYMIVHWLDEKDPLPLATMTSYIMSFISGKSTKRYVSVGLNKKS